MNKIKYINPYNDFGTAELATMTAEQREQYEYSLIHYWDMRNAIQTAVEDAVDEAVEKAVAKTAQETSMAIARKLLANGLDEQLVADSTGLLPEVIERLKSNR